MTDRQDESRRVAITGGTGYIGGRLLSALLDRGASVCAVVMPSDLTRLPDGVVRLEDEGSASALADRLSGFAPDAVFHLAACQDLTDSPEASDALVEANIAFAARMLSASRASGARAFVAASSYSVHAGGTQEYAPQRLYSATKQALATIAEYYRTKTGLMTLMLELSDTYGPGDPRPKFLNLIDRASRSGETLEVSPGEQRVRPLHVDDIVSAFIVGAESLLSAAEFAPTYSVAGAEEVTLKELVSAFEGATGRQVPVVWGGQPYRDGEIMRPWSGEPLPGWSPSVSLAEGLAAVYGS